MKDESRTDESRTKAVWWSPDPAVAALANALADRLDEHVIVMAERIRAEMDRYSEVAIEDLADSLRANTAFALAYLAGSKEQIDLPAAERTGRLRAVQGVPLAEVLRAYQLGFITAWDALVAEAGQARPVRPWWFIRQGADLLGCRGERVAAYVLVGEDGLRVDAACTVA
jgi:hypothetical protein